MRPTFSTQDFIRGDLNAPGDRVRQTSGSFHGAGLYYQRHDALAQWIRRGPPSVTAVTPARPQASLEPLRPTSALTPDRDTMDCHHDTVLWSVYCCDVTA